MNAIEQNIGHDSEPAEGQHAATLRRPWAQRGFRSAIRRRGGGAVLETILVLPLLLGLTMAVGEYGYFFYIKHNLVNASRAGARASIPAGATNTSVTDAINRSLSAAGMAPTNNLGNYTVTIKNSAGTTLTVSSTPVGTDIYVTVSAQWDTVGFRMIEPWLGGIARNKTVSATTVMRKEAT